MQLNLVTLHRLHPLVWLISSVIITFIIYIPGLNGPFQLDDFSNVLLTLPTELSWTEIFRILSTNHSSPTGRPVAVLTFIFNSYFSGLSPFYFKFVNLFIHSINGLLIWLFISRMLQLSKCISAQHIQLIAFSTALLWLIHPLQVSTVLYVVQRMTELSCLFTLLALLNYLAIRERLLKKVTFPFMHTLGLIICLFLALLSKENAALIALYIPLIEFYFFKLKTRSKSQHQYLIFILLMFSIFPILIGTYYLYTHAHNYLNYLNQPLPSRGWSISERLLSETNVLVYYLHNIVIPNIDKMSVFLDGFPVAKSFDNQARNSSIILISLLLLAIATIKKVPVLSFCILFYFTGHLIESTIHPLELAFEHRNYLPILGFTFALSYYLFETQWIQSIKLKLFIFSTLVLVYSVSTGLRSYEWGNENRMYFSAIENQPLSLRAHAGVINILLLNNRLEQARIFLQNAEQLPGNEIGFIVHRAQTYCSEINNSEAEKILKEATRRIPNSFITGISHESINNIQLRKMAKTCPAISYSAIIELTAAALTNTRYKSDDLGKLNLIHARSLNLATQQLEAVYYYKKALEKTPYIYQKQQILLELGILQIKLNDLDGIFKTQAELKKMHNPPYTNTEKKSKRLQSKLDKLLNAKK